MTGAARLDRMTFDQNERIAEVVEREQPRLRRFIRRRVPDPGDAEDILQDVFSTLVEANRLLMPIDHITGWLFRVARNRITDLFRKRRPGSLDGLQDLLPSPIIALNRAVAIGMAAGPQSAIALIDELANSGELDGYHLLPAARADMLRRLGSNREAAESYELALGLVSNESERRFLERRLREVTSSAH